MVQVQGCNPLVVLLRVPMGTDIRVGLVIV